MARTSPTKAPPRRNNKRSKRRPQRAPRAWLFISLALVVIAAVVIVIVVTSGSSSPNHKAVNAVTTAGVKYYGGLGPENVPLEVGTPLAPRNAHLTGAPVDGVSCDSSEQLAFHHHIHLAMFVDGQPRPLPLGVGMSGTLQTSGTARGPFAAGSSGCFYWLHVHAQDGIVHIESPVARPFFLGQVFALWGQPLSSSRLGPSTGAVTATIDGQPWTGDPNQIPLNEHSQIVLNVGQPAVAPTPITWSGTNL